MRPDAESLNRRFRHHGATAVLEAALNDPALGQIALVSSFGAESVVLLHLVSVTAPQTPVLFIDTLMHFEETLDYQDALARSLPLAEIRRIRALPPHLAAGDPHRELHKSNPDACCALRKSEPLERALTGFSGWITGRKRFQTGERAALEFFEEEPGSGRLKINPLAHWGRSDIEDYMVNNRLPRHPLIARGFASIGCATCTQPVNQGEDPRAGRWKGLEKTECGIHFGPGGVIRGAA